VFTDSVIRYERFRFDTVQIFNFVCRYLAAEHNATWATLKGLNKPIRIRDVVVLPVTGRLFLYYCVLLGLDWDSLSVGFSPGVGMFGAEASTSEEAMVQHMFAGSWKTGELTHQLSFDVCLT
jgi:hypothetical protein